MSHQVQRQMSTDDSDTRKKAETNEAKSPVTSVKIDQNKRKVDQLKEKLHMKLSALNAVKESKKQSESKVC